MELIPSSDEITDPYIMKNASFFAFKNGLRKKMKFIEERKCMEKIRRYPPISAPKIPKLNCARFGTQCKIPIPEKK